MGIVRGWGFSGVRQKGEKGGRRTQEHGGRKEAEDSNRRNQQPGREGDGRGGEGGGRGKEERFLPSMEHSQVKGMAQQGQASHHSSMSTGRRSSAGLLSGCMTHKAGVVLRL